MVDFANPDEKGRRNLGQEVLGFINKQANKYNKPSSSFSTRQNQFGIQAQRQAGGAGGIGAAAATQVAGASGQSGDVFTANDPRVLAAREQRLAGAPSVAAPVVASPVDPVAQVGTTYGEEVARRRLANDGGNQFDSPTRIGATDSAGNQIERGGGTFSVVSTPQSALDYNAEVAAQAQAKRDADIKTNLANREASYQRDLSAIGEREALKRQDSLLFEAGIGRYRKNADRDAKILAELGQGAVEGDIKRQDIRGENFRARLASGAQENAAASRASGDAINSLIRQQKNLADQSLKERKLGFERDDEAFDRFNATRTFTQGQERLGVQKSEAESKQQDRLNKQSIAEINARVNAGELDERMGKNISALLGDISKDPMQKSREGFNRYGPEWIKYDHNYQDFKKKLIGQNKEMAGVTFSPQQEVELFNQYQQLGGRI